MAAPLLSAARLVYVGLLLRRCPDAHVCIVISVVTLRCTVRLTVIRYGTVITVHHRILYGFANLGPYYGRLLYGLRYGP